MMRLPVPISHGRFLFSSWCNNGFATVLSDTYVFALTMKTVIPQRRWEACTLSNGPCSPLPGLHGEPCFLNTTPDYFCEYTVGPWRKNIAVWFWSSGLHALLPAIVRLPQFLTFSSWILLTSFLAASVLGKAALTSHPPPYVLLSLFRFWIIGCPVMPAFS